jgi:hypothetical protein
MKRRECVGLIAKTFEEAGWYKYFDYDDII